MPAWRSPRLLAAAGAAAALLLAGTLGGWTLGFAARRLAGAAPSPVPRATRALGAAVSVLLLAGLAGIAAELRPERFADLMIEVPAPLRASFAALSAGALLTLLLPVLAWRGLRPGAHAPLARLHLLVLAAAGLGLAVLAWYFELLGAWLA
jgi:hypothetical protein